jgi:hypothetical protein
MFWTDVFWKFGVSDLFQYYKTWTDVATRTKQEYPRLGSTAEYFGPTFSEISVLATKLLAVKRGIPWARDVVFIINLFSVESLKGYILSRSSV